MENRYSEPEEIKVARTNPNPDRHDFIVFEEPKTGLIHEFTELAEDIENPEVLKFRMKLSDKAGELLDGIEGWMEKKEIMEARDVKLWMKEHDKQITGASAVTIVAVAVGSLIIRKKRR